MSSRAFILLGAAFTPEVFVFARPNLFIFLALYCNNLGLSDVLLGLSICFIILGF